MRKLGVNDARKDADSMGLQHKGLEGDHIKMVKDSPSTITDPRSIDFKTKADHIERHRRDN